MTERRKQLEAALREQLPPLQVTDKLRKKFRADALCYIRTCEVRTATAAARRVFCATTMGVWLCDVDSKVLRVIKYNEIDRMLYSPPKKKKDVYKVLLKGVPPEEDLSICMSKDKLNAPKEFGPTDMQIMHRIMSTCKEFFMKKPLPLEEVANVDEYRKVETDVVAARERAEDKISLLKRGGLLKEKDIGGVQAQQRAPPLAPPPPPPPPPPPVAVPVSPVAAAAPPAVAYPLRPYLKHAPQPSDEGVTLERSASKVADAAAAPPQPPERIPLWMQSRYYCVTYPQVNRPPPQAAPSAALDAPQPRPDGRIHSDFTNLGRPPATVNKDVEYWSDFIRRHERSAVAYDVAATTQGRRHGGIAEVQFVGRLDSSSGCS